jgi:predicted pyridoxine 5'-phosphate oxidase superfamily flavin-nucleotide-binding protein
LVQRLVQIPAEATRLIPKADSVVLIGSVDRNGVPNNSPRFVLAVLGNERLLFADAFTNKTYANLKVNKKVTAAVVDRETMGGFQLKGEAEEVTDQGLIAQANDRLRQFGFDTRPHRIWTLDVKEVYSLKPSSRSKLPLISAYG